MTPITFTSKDIEFIRIKQRKYKRIYMKLMPKNGNLLFHVKYSTYGDNPLFGQLYDSSFATSRRYKLYPSKRKMVYVIPFFEDKLTKRINRNVRAEIVFDPHGWDKFIKYMLSFVHM